MDEELSLEDLELVTAGTKNREDDLKNSVSKLEKDLENSSLTEKERLQIYRKMAELLRELKSLDKLNNLNTSSSKTK